VAQSYFFTSFDPPTSTDTIPLGINNAGVVGGEFIDQDGNYHGFLMQNGVSTQVDAPGSTNTFLQQPNAAGLAGGTAEFGPVIGRAGIYNSVTQTWTFQPDIPGADYNSGGAINNHGVTAGNYYDSSGISHGWTWDGANYTFFDYPNQGSLGTIVQTINDAGEVVGFADDSSGTHHGFLEDGGIVTSIDVPGATSTSAFGLNNNDVITGRYRDSSDVAHGFLLQSGVYTTVDYPGAAYTTISGINDEGELTGFWEGADGVDHGFLAVATPEPGAIALFGSLGLTGVAFLRRKRTRRAA
jgi:probable HAF family extracellular repeat protein